MKIKRVLDSIDPKSLFLLLKNLCHRKGPGRKPRNPISILKAQLLKHLLRIPSDRKLTLYLEYGHKATRAYGFRKRTPRQGLFTRFRKRIGVNTNIEVFDHLLRGLMEQGAVKGEVVEADRNHVNAYIQRNRTTAQAGATPKPASAEASAASIRIPGSHRELRQFGDAPRLHRRPMQRERQDLIQANAGARLGSQVDAENEALHGLGRGWSILERWIPSRVSYSWMQPHRTLDPWLVRDELPERVEDDASERHAGVSLWLEEE